MNIYCTQSQDQWMGDPEILYGRQYRQGDHFPVDGREEEFLLRHRLWRKVLQDRLHLAILPYEVHCILVVGTGCTIWALDFSRKHPSTQVVVLDHSTTRLTLTPSNLQVLSYDYQAIQHIDRRFDFILLRGLVGYLGSSEWMDITKSVWDVLVPGGWLEIQDLCLPEMSRDTHSSGSGPLIKWSQALLEAGRHVGRPMDAALYHKGRMERSNFENVVEKNTLWELGGVSAHSRPLRSLYKEVLQKGLEALSLRLLMEGLDQSYEQVQLDLANVRVDIERGITHATVKATVLYGRKL